MVLPGTVNFLKVLEERVSVHSLLAPAIFYGIALPNVRGGSDERSKVHRVRGCLYKFYRSQFKNVDGLTHSKIISRNLSYRNKITDT